MSGRIRYTSDFKEDVIRKVQEEGLSVKDVSDQFGVSQKTIYDWLKRINRRSQQSDNADLRSEIEALKAELEKVKAEKEILRQAAILIARDN